MSENKTPICSKHNTELQDADCYRCGGQGYTDDDIEALDNPLEHSDGNCWQCRGSGFLKAVECDLCEQEAQMQEDEYFERNIS